MKLSLHLAIIANFVGSPFAFANDFVNHNPAQLNASCEIASSESSHVALGHIPKLVKAMNDSGKLTEDKRLPVMFALKLNNEDELNSRIAEMYRPGSMSFHQFLTSSEFKARYAPTLTQIAEERVFLESNGIAVQSVSENQMFIRAQASVATLNHVFKTELHHYLHKSGKSYFAPAYDIQIPNTSQIASVIGLNNTAKLHSRLVRHTAKPTGQPEGSAPGGGLAPADILKAYDVPNTATGEGQTLALFELDGYDPSDIQYYESQFGLPNVPLQNIYVDGATGKIGDPDAQGEVTLDIEMLAALAPKAKQILVYEGPTSDEDQFSSFEQGYLDIMQKIADDNLANQVSTSWGNPEKNFAASDLQAENTVFKQMAAQGQTVFAAAGDSGAEDDGSSLSVDNPASQPYVVGVGGTTVKISSAGDWQSETVWNELQGQHGAGGGGVSSVWSIPSWQSSAIANDRQASQTMRNVPDVALNSDPETGYAVYLQGQWQVIGGTSAAAPLWSAFNALVNQQRLANGQSPTGFLAQALYTVAQGNDYATSFIDIITGNNGTGSSSYKAGAGYDNATGFGAFRASGLIQQLSNL